MTAETTTAETVRRLRNYVHGGGTLVYVATRAGRAQTLAALTDDSPWVIEEAAIPRDVLLSEIAFDHPLFAPLAGAQYSDFTKIHFWNYRRIDPMLRAGAGRG